MISQWPERLNNIDMDPKAVETYCVLRESTATKLTTFANLDCRRYELTH
jgi:hypothetical protein